MTVLSWSVGGSAVLAAGVLSYLAARASFSHRRRTDPPGRGAASGITVLAQLIGSLVLGLIGAIALLRPTTSTAVVRGLCLALVVAVTPALLASLAPVERTGRRPPRRPGTAPTAPTHVGRHRAP